MNYKMFATVDELLIFRVSSSWSPFLFNKLGYLSPFDLFGHFCKFSKVTKSNLIVTDSRGHKISHQAFLPRDTWQCQQWKMDILCLKYLGDDVRHSENKLASRCYYLIWLLLSLILLLFWGCIFQTDNVAFAVNLKALHCFTLYEGKMLPSFLTAFCQIF